MSEGLKVSHAKRIPPIKFCEVCHHKVYDLEKHQQTEEHKRHLRYEQRLAGMGIIAL